MDKLKIQIVNKADENFKKLPKMFPYTIPDTIGEKSNMIRSIDRDVLVQKLSYKEVDRSEKSCRFIVFCFDSITNFEQTFAIYSPNTVGEVL